MKVILFAAQVSRAIAREGRFFCVLTGYRCRCGQVIAETILCAQNGRKQPSDTSPRYGHRPTSRGKVFFILNAKNKRKNRFAAKEKIPYLCSDNFAAPIGIVMMLCSPARLPCVADGHFFCTYAMFFCTRCKVFRDIFCTFGGILQNGHKAPMQQNYQTNL